MVAGIVASVKYSAPSRRPACPADAHRHIEASRAFSGLLATQRTEAPTAPFLGRRKSSTTEERDMRIGTLAGIGLVILTSALWSGVPAAAQPNSAGFPDVPPWHWAYQGVLKDAQAGVVVGYPASPEALIDNSITQVYDSFVHAQARAAQGWAERFTYNRPAAWPGPFDRAQLASFSIRNVRSRVDGDAATASFVAETQTRGGQSATTPMRVTLRLMERDWKIDYATLAAGSALFR
jgi:hypothetical protein